jgi:hypothetical protein
MVLNSETGALEVTINLFAEDVENVVRKYKDPDYNLDNDSMDALATETMAVYIAGHFKVGDKNSRIELQFLGMELKDEMALCYLESRPVENPPTLKIENTLLFDLQDEQVNFNHVKVNGETRSAKTTVVNPVAEISSSSR